MTRADRVPLKTADEVDVFSRHRHIHKWCALAGRKKRVRRGYNRRVRRMAKADLRGV